MKRIKLAGPLAAIAVLTAAPASAQDAHPGLAGIDWGKHVGASEPTVTVQLSPTLLRFMASMASEAAAEASEIQGVNEIIGQLHQVRVEVYEDLDDKGLEDGHVQEAADTEIDALKGLGWETIVRARDGGDHVDVMMLPQRSSIVGFVVIAAEKDELAFVNVAGDFDPESLGKHLGAIVKQASNGELKLQDLVDVDIEEMIEEAVEEAAK